jgi:hypothetical protein
MGKQTPDAVGLSVVIPMSGNRLRSGFDSPALTILIPDRRIGWRCFASWLRD